MTKLLPPVEQAKIKLLLSNSVLQAEIRNTSNQTASLSTSSPFPSEATTSSSRHSTYEELQPHYKPTLGEMLNMNHDIEFSNY